MVMLELSTSHGHDRRGTGPPPRPPDQYFRAWLARRTIDEWRAADQVLRRSKPSSARAWHERAVSIALQSLARFGSVDGLVEHYTTDRFRRLGDSGSAPEGTVEAWAADACASVEGAPVIDQQLVVGAAFWRRATELMAGPPA
jgi:hypothetical protein